MAPSELFQRRRPHVRTRVHALPPGSPAHGCVLSPTLFDCLFGQPADKPDSTKTTVYAAISIPSLTVPSTSGDDDGSDDDSDDRTDDCWKIFTVRSNSSAGAETPPKGGNNNTVGSVGVPAGLFSIIGAASASVSSSRNKTVNVGVVGFIQPVAVLTLERVVVYLDRPVAAGENGENGSDRFVASVKKALLEMPIVRERDRFSLEDGTSASIELAEPIRQGVVGPDTRVVIHADRAPSGPKKKARINRPISFAAIDEEDESGGTERERGSGSGSDELSGLSDDDDSVMCLAPTTPMMNGLLAGGIATPGSMMSTLTSGQPRTAVFAARVLTRPVRREAVVPLPAEDDIDDDVRIFARPAGLVRVGVLAGDWVWIEDGADLGFGFDPSESTSRGRAVRIYALPGDNQVGMGGSAGAEVVISPVLYGNLGSPLSVRLSRHIIGTSRVKIGASPPMATEVRLVRLASQIGLEKRAQAAIVAGVKRHFAGRRLAVAGDLVPISIAVGDGEEAEDTVAMARAEADVVWFRVAAVDVDRDEGAQKPELSVRSWGWAVVDPHETTLVQAGAEHGRVFCGTNWRQFVGLTPIGPTSEQGNTARASTDGLVGRLTSLFRVSSSRAADFLPPARILITGKTGSGKAWAVRAAAAAVGLHVFEIDCWEVLAHDRDVQAEAVLRARIERAAAGDDGATLVGASTVVLIRNIHVLDNVPLGDILDTTRLVVATGTPDVAAVKDDIRALFAYELTQSVPAEAERAEIVRAVVKLRGLRCGRDVSLDGIARRTAALVAADLVDLVDRAEANRQRRIGQVIGRLGCRKGRVATVDDALVAGGDLGKLSRLDFDTAADAARKNFADAIGAPKIPSVTWADVGGLDHVRRAVTETIQLPLARPELFASGLKKRSGILFYGPPGTGKTLVAKAIATEYGLNFFSVKGPELLNMYIGESEANVRRVFQRARDARPCVVFFDELDSVAPKRGNQGDSGGVMDRIVAQLLAELDGMSGGGGSNGGAGSGPKDGSNQAGQTDQASGVFVVGATNRPDLLDQALLRPGRFDKIVYLGLPDTIEKRVNIMSALSRKFTLSDDVRFEDVVGDGGLTGADLYALCADAMLGAVGRRVETIKLRISQIEASRRQEVDETGIDPDESATKGNGTTLTTAQFFDYHAKPEDLAVVVTQHDFVHARQELVPSVSADELRHYERVRDSFEGNDRAEGKKVVGVAVAESGSGQDVQLAVRQGKGKETVGKAVTVVGEPDQERVESGSLAEKTKQGLNKTLKQETGQEKVEKNETNVEEKPDKENGPIVFGSGADDDGMYDDDGVKLS